MGEPQINRRSFLQATGALVGLAAATGMIGCSNLKSAPEDGKTDGANDVTLVKSQCRMCHGVCGTLIHVRNGRVIKVEGYAESPVNKGTLCPKGLATIQHQYNPRRLRYPLKRSGERGEGGWEKISWDEAYQIIVDKLHETWDNYGKEYMAMASGTGRHQQDWNGIFMNALGFRNSSFGMPPLCYLPRIQVSTRMFGYRIPVADYIGLKGDKKPGVVLFWGNNIINSNADGMQASAPLRAVNAGAKLYCIDPVFTSVASKAEIWLPVRPATDLALAMGFLNVIVNEDLYDHEFIEKWSNLPGLVRDDNGKMLTENDLAGIVPEEIHGPPFMVMPPELLVFWDADKNEAVLANGPDINPAMSGSFLIELPGEGSVQCHTAWDDLVKRVNEYPLSKVAEITACKEEDIATVARSITKDGPLALQWGVSFDQWGVNSADAIQAALMLVALSGSLDVPGGMCMWNSLPLRKGSFPSELSEKYVTPEMYRAELLPAEVNAKGAEYAKVPWGGGGANFYIEAVAKGEERCEFLWVVGANPLANTGDTKQVLQALKNVGFIVVWDHYMTSTAQRADLVLPVAIWTEMSRLADMHFVWGMQARIKAVEPIGEARSDEMGCMGLAKKLAETDPEYWNEQIPWTTEEEWINWRLEPMDTNWDDFKEKWLHVAPQEPYSYKESKFLLPAGKAELFLRAKTKQNQDPLPLYREQPLYSPNNTELTSQYPFTCVTRRVAGYFHSEYRQLPYMREIWPEPMIELNPGKGAELGIADGDWVCVESERGKIKLKAILTPAVAADVVCCQHDWWFPEVAEGKDPELSGIMESNLSVLVNNDQESGYDALIGTPILRGFFVNIYKSPDGPPKGLNPEEVFTWMPEAEEAN